MYALIINIEAFDLKKFLQATSEVIISYYSKDGSKHKALYYGWVHHSVAISDQGSVKDESVEFLQFGGSRKVNLGWEKLFMKAIAFYTL